MISFILCMISGCSQATSTHVIKKDFSKEQFVEIDYSLLQNMLDQKESFVLYIGRPDCKDCQEFEPYLKQYLDNHQGVYLYYFNIKVYRDLSKKEDASQEEKEFYQQLVEKLDFSWTPTLKFIYQGEIEKSYTYLDESYYSISSKEKKKEKKQEYIDNLTKWLNNIYVEENEYEKMSKM
ncbi:MAG: thioredoxin family protein [Faecalibacillus sp.]